ncbi:hypothetical protein AGDE_13089 [Angomonas deanei]|nr:hypothetical protein AGDE_13089 [Angomonas deanei]|eukprot:EPY22797.1 hypothetical protein AGDE_13089 [Angomonas deanei]
MCSQYDKLDPEEGESSIRLYISTISVLCTSYVRRLRFLVGEKKRSLLYSDLTDAEESEDYTDEYVDKIHSILTDLLTVQLAGANEKAKSKWTQSVRGLIDYGLGEVLDFKCTRHDRAKEVLLSCLSDAVWNVSRIENLIIIINKNSTSRGGVEAKPLREGPLETTKVSSSLRDPFLHNAIAIPARGRGCKHFDVFDLKSFVSFMGQKSVTSRRDGCACPFCSERLRMEEVIIDFRVWDCLRSSKGTEKPIDPSSSGLEWDLEKDELCIVQKNLKRRPEEDIVVNDEEGGTTSRGESSQTKRSKFEIDGHTYYLEQ